MLVHYCHKSPGKGVKSEVFSHNTQLFRLAKKVTNCENIYIKRDGYTYRDIFMMTSSELTNITQEQNLEIDSSVECSAV